MKQRQGVYTYRRGDRVDCIDRSTKAGLEPTEAAEAVVYGNLYCKMDKGAAKQGRKYRRIERRLIGTNGAAVGSMSDVEALASAPSMGALRRAAHSSVTYIMSSRHTMGTLSRQRARLHPWSSV